MKRWIKIHQDREWRSTKFINIDHIQSIRVYDGIDWVEIISKVGWYTRKYWIERDKDSEFEDIIKMLEEETL